MPLSSDRPNYRLSEFFMVSFFWIRLAESYKICRYQILLTLT
jgi:hypothetical protein